MIVVSLMVTIEEIIHCCRIPDADAVKPAGWSVESGSVIHCIFSYCNYIM